MYNNYARDWNPEPLDSESATPNHQTTLPPQVASLHLRTTDMLIDQLICPPPPSQSEYEDPTLDDLIIPAPTGECFGLWEIYFSNVFILLLFHKGIFKGF